MFSALLREEAAVVFDRIYEHPFVTGIGKGEVPKEALIHYVKADYEYLTAFARIYGLAISKCETRHEMEFFQNQIQFVLHSEIHPHHVFCRAAGVRYEDLQHMPLPPAADHYVSHMMSSAQGGDMGELLAALLPCPWTYHDLAQKLAEEIQPDTVNPFYDWIMFYAKPKSPNVTSQLRARLDTWAETAGAAAKEKARQAFLKSCMLELAFWEMALMEEEWVVPLQKGVTKHVSS